MHYGIPVRRCGPLSSIVFGMTCWALGLAVSADDPPPSPVDSKLDDAIEASEDNVVSVFVRMSDQLLPAGGDYEAFCRQHEGKPRSELRRFVLDSLREKAKRSWGELSKLVDELRDKEQIIDVERFWIVNGFACDATPAACRQLAASPAIAFIYLQRGPIRQHKAPTGRGLLARQGATLEQQRRVYEQVLADWRDDAEEPLPVDDLDIPWNLKRIGADAAWREAGATGAGVVVAICDSGLMTAPSLVRALWRNPGEELNDKDDDGNGYVDDLFGYDFAARSFYALGDSPLMPHGSMCGGIIAGRPSKDKLITGVAPRARLMVLRGMGYLKAYEYALSNGADVISMSYMWVRAELGHYRGLYRTAHEHLAAGGIVSVGGAGNFSHLAPGEQIALPKDIPCVIAAAGIVEDGTKAPPGSEGPCYWNGVKFYGDYPAESPLVKPDVTGCFGGYPVWGRAIRFGGRIRVVSDEGDGFALVVGPQGNSFSGPHAAGVAALMFSVNPELNAWQVKRLMEQTCEDLGEPGRDTVFGAGLLQALPAVQAAQDAGK